MSYRYLSDALAEVIRERDQQQHPSRLGSTGATPIFDRIVKRRGWPRHQHEFTGWSKQQLRSYIARYQPASWSPTVGERGNRRSLVRLAERVRDWQGMDERYPSDQDLVIPLHIEQLGHAFTGGRWSCS